MDSLISTILDCFSNQIYNSNWRHHSSVSPGIESSYMMIPVSEDSFELPVFALPQFTAVNMERTGGKMEAMVAEFKDANLRTAYSSMDAKVRDVLSMSYWSHNLVKIVDGNASGSPYYYGTHGLLLDRDFAPMMMMSWIMEKIHLEDKNAPVFRCRKPLLRVAPSVFRDRSNSIERYIVNRIVPAALSIDDVRRPSVRDDIFKSDSIYTNQQVKVEIDKCPFRFMKTEVPSISTTNEELLITALDNIDEVLQ